MKEYRDQLDKERDDFLAKGSNHEAKKKGKKEKKEKVSKTRRAERCEGAARTRYISEFKALERAVPYKLRARQQIARSGHASCLQLARFEETSEQPHLGSSRGANKRGRRALVYMAHRRTLVHMCVASKRRRPLFTSVFGTPSGSHMVHGSAEIKEAQEAQEGEEAQTQKR